MSPSKTLEQLFGHMNVGRRSDGVASARVTLELIKFIGDHGGTLEIGIVVDSIGRLFHASRSKAWNTIQLLADLDILRLQTTADTVRLNKWHGDDADEIAIRLVGHLLSRLIPPNFGSTLQIEPHDGSLWIDSKRFPGRNLGIPYLLQDLGVCIRETLSSRHWQIAPAFKRHFLRAAEDQNMSLLQEARFTLRDLQHRMAVQAARGKAAEEWVVELEKDRLSGHSFVEQVRRISEQHVAAGFDILSFENVSSLSHDWFIEVKSYEGTPTFFWSRREAERAKDLKERYALYLVNRNCMAQDGYKPIVIAGPYDYFFESGIGGWKIVANEYWLSMSA